MNLGYTFDLTQAGVLSYEDGYVDVYSNSWGPVETGFTVGGPGYLTLQTFQREARQVSCVDSLSPYHGMKICLVVSRGGVYGRHSLRRES